MEKKVNRIHLDIANIQELKNFLDNKYARNLILKTDNIEIILLCLMPGQNTPIHDHGKSDGVTIILEGKLSYTNYFPGGSKESGVLKSGDVEYIPANVEHKIANNTDEKIITLNIYSPPLDVCSSNPDLLYANNIELSELKLPEKTIQFLKAALKEENYSSNKRDRNSIVLKDSSRRKTVVIIGGGFSGTLVATQLMRKAAEPTRVVLIERAPRFARGFAYSTNSSQHLLNVPAGKMSAFPEEPEHFLKWTQSKDSNIQSDTFVPRMLYGQYLETILHEADVNKSSEVRFDRLNDEAISINPDNENEAAIVELESGLKLFADKVVLAVGNYSPRNPYVKENSFYKSKKYFRDPWSSNSLLSLNPDDSVLLIGTGLTMVDKAIELVNKGHKGIIYAISRHGYLPKEHKPGLEPLKIDFNFQEAKSIRQIFLTIREKMKSIMLAGGDWRQVIDSLRSKVQEIWQSLSIEERKRFFRHLRPLWDIHRHRMPPDISEKIMQMLANKQLVVKSARIMEYKEQGDYVDILVCERPSDKNDILRVARVVNCTGSEFDFCQIQDPLIVTLLEQGLIASDKLSLGLDATTSGVLKDINGNESNILYTLGPPLKGQLWETTAVPEIREQAFKLANILVESTVKELTK